MTDLPLFIARRLSFRADGRRQRSPGVVIAVAGVATAITVMLITLAVVSGFRNSITAKVAGFDSQLTIRIADSATGDVFFTPDSALVATIRKTVGGKAEISGALAATAVLKTDSDFVGITLVGEQYNSAPWRFIAQNVADGTMPMSDGSSDLNSIVLSKTTANILKLSPGDRPFVYFVSENGVKTRRLTVEALYDTSFGERDKLLAVVSPDMLRSVAGIDSCAVSSLNVNGLHLNDISTTRSNLQRALNNAYYGGVISRLYDVTDVKTTGAVYFSWLDLLDTNVIVIIILMSLVASFTLVSSLFILILERVVFVGILKALGATDKLVGRVFILLAMKIVGLGLLVGNIVGLGLLWIQHTYKLVPLNPEAYYLSFVPVEISFPVILLLNVCAIAVAWFVLIVPTAIISRISPVNTMRYE